MAGRFKKAVYGGARSWHNPGPVVCRLVGKEASMLKVLRVSSAALVAACLVGVALGGELKSGLQVGESAPAFNVRNITGQECVGSAKATAGSLCYR